MIGSRRYPAEVQRAIDVGYSWTELDNGRVAMCLRGITIRECRSRREAIDAAIEHAEYNVC